MPSPSWSVQLGQEDSTIGILGLIAGFLFILIALYLIGLLDRIFDRAGQIIQSIVNLGFSCWERTLFWVRWPSYLVLCTSLLTVGIHSLADNFSWLGLLIAVVLLSIGVTACLAFIFVSLERYEVSRGHKAIHNPAKGQDLARHVIRYGDRLGPLMLAISAVVTILGFALLNQALFQISGTSWYLVRDPAVEPRFLDFLAFTLIHLLRMVDVLDLVSSSQFVTVTFVRQGAWPVAVMLMVFKSFFMLVLFQQIIAAIREQRTLGEMVADFWNPHAPIHDRARIALAQFGPMAVAPVMQFLERAESLTKEQRTELPKSLADLGPLAIPEIIRHLRIDSPTVRSVAALALGHLEAVAAARSLAWVSRDPHPAVRACAAEALGIIGHACVELEQDESARTTNKRGAWRLKAWIVRGSSATASVFAFCWRQCRRPFGRLTFSRHSRFPGSLTTCIEALTALLADPESAVRVHAAVALGRIGPRAEPATSKLVASLNDEADLVRCQAATALGQLRTLPDQVVPALAEVTRDSSPTVRIAAATALGQYEKFAISALGALSALVEEKLDPVRDAATAAIARIGVLSAEATQKLEGQLVNPDSLCRAQAAEVLGEIGEAAETSAPALVESLEDDNDLVRIKAAQALGRIGEAAAEVAIPALVESLSDDDVRVQAQSAEALGQMGADAKIAIPPLLGALKSSNANVRGSAAQALGRLQAEQSRPQLEAACRDEATEVRIQAALALGHLGETPQSTLDVLLATLSDGDPKVREIAIRALSRNMAHRESIVPAIAELINDQEPSVSLQAMEAITTFGTDALPMALDALVSRLKDENHSDLASAAADALGRFGAVGSVAGVELMRAAQTGDNTLRRKALKTLSLIAHLEALPVLASGLHDADGGVRRQASAGLLKFNSIPEELIPQLVASLNDPDPRVQGNVLRVLTRMPTIPPDAEALVYGFAQSPVDDLRRAAASALGRIDSAQSRAALRRLAEDFRPRIRQVAGDALANLESDLSPPETTDDNQSASNPAEAKSTRTVLVEAGNLVPAGDV